MPNLEQIFDNKNHNKSLIKGVLMVVLGISLFAGTLNLVVFKPYGLGSLNVLSALFTGVLFYYYYRRGNVTTTSWLLCGVVIFKMLALISLTKGSSYTLLWLSVLPPICFFLLGRKGGSWLVGLTFGLVAVYVYYMRTEKITSSLTVGSLLNIVCVFIILWLLFRHYEASRASAYNALERLSITDKLTGLFNRSKLDEVLTEQLGIAARLQQPMVVVLADCDHFKTINDTYGHLYGDYVLKKLAETLKTQARESDFIGRWGGEEFLIICPATTPEQAQAFIERLRAEIAALTLRQNRQVTMTFGIAQNRDKDDITNIINRADRALYQGKENGRNCVVLYS